MQTLPEQKHLSVCGETWRKYRKFHSFIIVRAGSSNQSQWNTIWEQDTAHTQPEVTQWQTQNARHYKQQEGYITAKNPLKIQTLERVFAFLQK